MRSFSVKLPDDVYWYLYEWGVRENRKLYQQAEHLLTRAVELDRESNQDTTPTEVEVA